MTRTQHHNTLPRHTSNGFTLLEILLVMTIAVLALGVVAPNFAQLLSSITFEQQSRSLVQVLRDSRQKALRYGITQQLQIAPRQITQNDQILLSLDNESLLRLRDDNGAEPTEQRLLFYADGGSSGGQLLLSRPGRQQRIQIHWLTGAVKHVADQ